MGLTMKAFPIKKRFRINRVVFVVDRGMISKENIRLLDELGLEYIIGVKLRQKKEVKEDVVSRVPPRVIELNVVPTSSFTLKGAHKQ